MDSVDPRLKDIAEIRSLMEQSSKFLSLSGLSGVSAGTAGLLAYLVANHQVSTARMQSPESLTVFFCAEATVTLVCALGMAVFFSTRMARRKGLPLWTPATRALLVSLLIPLAAGGVYSLILLSRGLFSLIAPAMLVFYGLALLSSSKYTLAEIRTLGLSELLLGLAGTLWTEYGLLAWGIGFGLLHILYGTSMYFKYEK